MSAAFALALAVPPLSAQQSSTPVDALAHKLSVDPTERENAGKLLENLLLLPDASNKSFVSADADHAALGALAREWAKAAEPGRLAPLIFASTPKSKSELRLRALLAPWTGSGQITKGTEKGKAVAFLEDAAIKAGQVLHDPKARAEIDADIQSNDLSAATPLERASIERASKVARGGSTDVFGPNRAPAGLAGAAADSAGVTAGSGGHRQPAPMVAAPLPATRSAIETAVPTPANVSSKDPDPKLKTTTHQAMASDIIGRFGIGGYNGKPDAMQVVITARGGGENGTAGIKGEGGPEWARAQISALFPGETPFTDERDMRLARIDHIINVQKAVNDVAPMKESDPWYVKTGKSLKRMPTAAGGAVITVLYDASKLVDQTFGTNTGALGNQDFSKASPVDLKNTAGALWMTVKSPFLIEQ
jgi:hypothetical protein